MKALADPPGENEGQPAALDLLVLAHGGENRVRVRVEAGNVADAGRQADGL